MKYFYKEIILFSWLLLIAILFAITPINNYSFYNGIIASGKLCDYEYFLITVLFVNAKDFAFLLHPIFVIFCKKYVAAF